MTRLLVIVMTLAGLVLTYPLGKRVVDTVRAGGLSKEVASNAPQLSLPKQPNLLDSAAPVANPTLEVLTLEARNTVTFRGPVLGSTVSKAIKEISAISRNIPKNQPIYLVMDTPGGSIMDGADFIDFLSGIPQEVRTVTLFSASMGFHIVESNPGKRLIARNGVLMSHRAKGGVEGQFDGELETEYRMVKRKIDYLEVVASARMGLTLPDYKAKIKDEFWSHGFEAQADKVADSMVAIRCGDTLTGEDAIKLETMFGTITAIFDKCPLIKDPIRVEMPQTDPGSRMYLNGVLSDIINNKRKFIKEFVDSPSNFSKLFR